jgi:hypothetical protein
MADDPKEPLTNEQLRWVLETVVRGAVQGAVSELRSQKPSSDDPQLGDPPPSLIRDTTPSQLDEGNLTVTLADTEPPVEIGRGFSRAHGGHVIEIMNIVDNFQNSYFGAAPLNILSEPFSGLITTKIESAVQAPAPLRSTILMVAKINNISRFDIHVGESDELTSAIEPKPLSWSESLYLIKQSGETRGVLHRLRHKVSNRVTETWFRRSDLVFPGSNAVRWRLEHQDQNVEPPPTVQNLLESLKTTSHDWAVRSFTYYIMPPIAD